MFLLDTNVVSELRKVGSKNAHPQVELWARETPGEQSYISVISIFEIERGVLLTERRDAEQGALLRQWFDHHVLDNYAERILPIHSQVALRCARLHVPDPIPAYDALIAATALVHGLTLVTRNVNDFERTGVEIINPWEFGRG